MGKLLIDADQMIYAAGFAVQKTSYFVCNPFNDVIPIPRKTKKAAKNWCKERNLRGKLQIEIELEPFSHAAHLLRLQANKILAKYPTYTSVFYLTDDNLANNFRTKIAKTVDYKSGRKDIGRPEYYSELRTFLLTKYPSQLVSGYEADDAVIMNYEEGDIICGIDKDLLQFPGKFYNYSRDEEFEIDERTANFNFFSQILGGDVSDSVPGLKYWLNRGTCGEKGLATLFDSAVTRLDFYGRIWAHYQKHLKEEYQPCVDTEFYVRFQEMAQLLYLKRTSTDMWSWDYIIDDLND